MVKNRIRQIYQCDTNWRAEINPHLHGQLIYDKGTKSRNAEKKFPLTSGAKKTGKSAVSHHAKKYTHNIIKCQILGLKP